MHGTQLRLISLTGAALAMTLVAACGGGGTGPTPATGLPTGKPVTDLTKLCELVGPGDWSSVGIAGAGTPTTNSDGPGSAYCVYAGQSAGTGGIEFDVFVDEDSASTFQTVKDEIGGDLISLPLPGADEVVATDGVAGKADRPAGLALRKGNLVVVLGAPGGTGVSAKLAALAALVVARAAGLTG
jgi:hypothetical protein